ncbi:MAG TPA: AmmeMemoRadiSam system protein B [Candidatus Coatesbacteria bacterium]|nr:AmmeMemoRadiSam system protein B [Candidatus Coatesbacteria bacterium]
MRYDLEELKRRAAGRVRAPAVAGSFYPAPPEALKRQVEELLRRAEVEPLCGVRALVAPHAGYVYSGAVAACAYASIGENAFRRAAVVAPTHRVPFDGVSAYIGEAFETPLGPVEVDLEALAALSAAYPLKVVAAAHELEHSLEVQLPFIQAALPGARLVPLLMGSQDEETARGLGEALAAVFAEETLVVASSDLSHYHEDSVARVLDGVVEGHVRSLEPARFLRAVESGQAAACGAGPMAAAMFYARAVGATVPRVVAYATSGDVTGDRRQVVGYLSAVFTMPVAVEDCPDLDRHERRALLRLAREALENHFAGEKPPEPKAPSARLKEKRGAFVTLTEEGRLRGCIGYVEPVVPLWRAVREMAVAAATGDPRFSPVSPDELERLRIEISVLSPLTECRDPGRVTVGRHGLIVRRGGRSGLLLPQVPQEQGWDREEFLAHTCLKAGLGPEDWKSGAELYTFTAQVFGE